MPHMNMDEPPNFSGQYPLAGSRIGPAWRLGWHELVAAYPRWVPGPDLSARMSEAGIQERTAKGLLQGARRARLLAVRYRKSGQHGQRRAEYRVLSA